MCRNHARTLTGREPHVKSSIGPALVVGGLLFVSGTAEAHVSLDQVGQAGQRQVLSFGVGHGCAGDDTLSVEIRLPEEVTSVRAVPWAFGDAEVVTSSAGVPIAVVFERPGVKAADDQYYTVQLRITVPDMPFETLYFPAIQTCRDESGTDTVVEWIGLPGDPDEPAPALTILPAHRPGWNRIEVTRATDPAIFGEAQIVWQGDAAYSSNPAIMDLIGTTEGVTVLTELAPGTEIWVKF